MGAPHRDALADRKELGIPSRCSSFYKGLSGNAGELHKAGAYGALLHVETAPVESPPQLPVMTLPAYSTGGHGTGGGCPFSPAFPSLPFRRGTVSHPGWISPMALIMFSDHLAVVWFPLGTRIYSNLAVIIA